jgi:hypothetical protein
MTQRSITNDQHPDELLPWFVNQSLSDHEREQVEVHLQSCKQCQQGVEFLRKVREEVKTFSPSLPGELGLKRLLRDVKQDSSHQQGQGQKRSWWWGNGLAIAASLVIMVQAGLLMDAWFFSKTMAPLSGPHDFEVTLQITFQPNATEADIRQMVNAINGTFSGGPGQLGIYRIRLPLPPQDEAGIEEAMAYLRNQGKVVSHVARE